MKIKKVLFVCTANKYRSRTAEDLFKNNSFFEVKSAGTDETAIVQVNRALLEWADIVFVMEKNQRNKIRKLFPDIYKSKKIICLYIDDIYDYNDPELISLIKERTKEYL